MRWAVSIFALSLLLVLCCGEKVRPDELISEIKQVLGRVSVSIGGDKKQEAIELCDETIAQLQRLKAALKAKPKDPVKRVRTQPALTDLVVNITFNSTDCEKKAETGDYIRVHYVGKTLEDDKMFASSFFTGSIPFKFELGTDAALVPGWNQGLIGACVGERRRLLIPAKLGFGEKGFSSRAGEVEPDADLKFDIEVTSISKMRKRKSEL